MPKATRGRRPAPNPKRHVPKQATREITPGVASLARPEATSFTGSSVVASASRPATRPSFSVTRRGVPAIQRKRFADSIADYGYVPQDLRRIGIYAGGLVVLLVGLSILLP